MVKNRFMNLPEKKRQVYTKQLLDIFHDKQNAEISVTHIVNELGIARGSFYKYFEDVEDVSNYLVKLAAREVHIKLRQAMETTGGVFSGVKSYLQQVNLSKEDSEEFKQIRLLTSRHRFHPRIPLERTEMGRLIHRLNGIEGIHLNPSELRLFVQLVGDTTISYAERLLSGSWSIEELEEELEILERWLQSGIKEV